MSHGQNLTAYVTNILDPTAVGSIDVDEYIATWNREYSSQDAAASGVYHSPAATRPHSPISRGHPPAQQQDAPHSGAEDLLQDLSTPGHTVGTGSPAGLVREADLLQATPSHEPSVGSESRGDATSPSDRLEAVHDTRIPHVSPHASTRDVTPSAPSFEQEGGNHIPSVSLSPAFHLPSFADLSRSCKGDSETSGDELEQSTSRSFQRAASIEGNPATHMKPREFNLFTGDASAHGNRRSFDISGRALIHEYDDDGSLFRRETSSRYETPTHREASSQRLSPPPLGPRDHTRSMASFVLPRSTRTEDYASSTPSFISDEGDEDENGEGYYAIGNRRGSLSYADSRQLGSPFVSGLSAQESLYIRQRYDNTPRPQASVTRGSQDAHSLRCSSALYHPASVADSTTAQLDAKALNVISVIRVIVIAVLPSFGHVPAERSAPIHEEIISHQQPIIMHQNNSTPFIIPRGWLTYILCLHVGISSEPRVFTSSIEILIARVSSISASSLYTSISHWNSQLGLMLSQHEDLNFSSTTRYPLLDANLLWSPPAGCGWTTLGAQESVPVIWDAYDTAGSHALEQVRAIASQQTGHSLLDLHKLGIITFYVHELGRGSHRSVSRVPRPPSVTAVITNPTLWHCSVAHIRDMTSAVKARCQHGYGTLTMCWRALVMLSKMGIHTRKRGLVQIRCEGGIVQAVDADEMLTQAGLNAHAFWNYRGHARNVQGRRLALSQLSEPRSAHAALALWLLELMMDSTLPPFEMDVAAGEELGTNEIVRDLLYSAGIGRVLEFLGLRAKRKGGRRPNNL